MELYTKHIVFTVSLLILFFILYLMFIIGKKQGIKKSLYKISYRSICIVFAFVTAPQVNEYLVNYNLYDIGKSIKYNGLHFYRFIDFFEEIIVHNEVLNDIYNLIPSLKNLLMDFPQVLFVPFTYVLIFMIISLLLFPAYLYLTHKSDNKFLYDKPTKKSPEIWAGILNCVQFIFVVSVVLTPVNGLTRMYKESTKGLIEENTNICKETKYIEKYAFACSIIEGYNSSIFALLGEVPTSGQLYNSLTRINYDDKNTNLSNEVVSIARAGVVLNKTGLLSTIEVESFEEVNDLSLNSLTSEDIDVVIEAFKQSVYTKDVMDELYNWSKSYLDWIMVMLVGEEFQFKYEYDDMVEELEIILRTLNYILNKTEFLDNIKEVYMFVNQFINDPITGTNIPADIRLFFDVAYTIDLETLKDIFNYLKQSKIYRDVVPQILENVMIPLNLRVNFSDDPQELNQAIEYIFDIIEIVKNHAHIYDVIRLVNDLTQEELHHIARIINYFNQSQTMPHLIHDIAIFAVKSVQLDMDLPYGVIYKIKDWSKELELAQLAIQIVYTYIDYGYIDYDKAWYILKNYDNTILFETAIKYAVELLPDVFVMWIAGKDYTYLVGEYLDRKIV